MATSSTASTTASTNFLSTLGAGSGIDTKSLAQDLANAEIGPRKDAINGKITKTEAKISAYGYIKSALNDLKTAFAKLDDASEFSSIAAANSQTSAIGVTATTTAKAGSYKLEVTNLATAQRSSSNSFTKADESLNTGHPFNISFSLHSGQAQTIEVTDDSPLGVVRAINQAKVGVEAQLLNTGDPQAPYVIVVSGATGTKSDFTLTADANQLDFSNKLSSADDARLKLNGLTISRSSNHVSDLIEGVTLDLLSVTSGSATIDLSRQTTSIKDGVKGLVTAYNDLETTLKELGNSKSKVEQVGGALVGDSLLQSIRSQVRRYITEDSSTKSGNLAVKAARDIGLSFDRNGQLQLDESKFDNALQSNFDEVVKAFTAGTNNKSIYSPSPAGIAGDAVVKLDKMLRTTGIVATQVDSANSQIEDYKAQLTKLDDRMTKLLERYTQQFSLMDSVVGNSASVRAGLKNSFSNMTSSN